MGKLNCWEFKKCGREIGGAKAAEMGVCQTAMEARLGGIHGGRSAGRSCWVVAGTLCGGAEQGTFAQKYHNCKTCDFYNTVRKEEGMAFMLSATLLARLKQAPVLNGGKTEASKKVR